MRKVDIVCKNCRKLVSVVQWDIENRIFCNHSCYSQYRKSHIKEYLLPPEVYKASGRKGSYTIRQRCNRKGEHNSNWRPKVLIICQYCKKEFFVTENYNKDGTVKYCSRVCKDLSQVGEDRHGKTLMICQTCKKPTLVPSYLFRKGLRKYCSKLCSNRSLKDKIGREKHHNWNGGTSLKPYPFDFNDELKELIRKRDIYKCQLCSVPQIECLKKLSIHHIDYNKENIDPKNLITLCSRCNSRVNYKKEYWQKVFAEKTSRGGGAIECHESLQET